MEDISHILITHAHLDHIGSLAALKKSSSAQVVAGVKDTAYIQGLKKTWTMGREGFGGKIFKTVLFFMETFVFHYEPAQVEIPCHGGEIIDCFGGIQVIATPGHSPGSVSFYAKEKGLILSATRSTGPAALACPCASAAPVIRRPCALSSSLPCLILTSACWATEHRYKAMPRPDAGAGAKSMLSSVGCKKQPDRLYHKA